MSSTDYTIFRPLFTPNDKDVFMDVVVKYILNKQKIAKGVATLNDGEQYDQAIICKDFKNHKICDNNEDVHPQFMDIILRSALYHSQLDPRTFFSTARIDLPGSIKLFFNLMREPGKEHIFKNSTGEYTGRYALDSSGGTDDAKRDNARESLSKTGDNKSGLLVRNHSPGGAAANTAFINMSNKGFAVNVYRTAGAANQPFTGAECDGLGITNANMITIANTPLLNDDYKLGNFNYKLSGVNRVIAGIYSFDRNMVTPGDGGHGDGLSEYTATNAPGTHAIFETSVFGRVSNDAGGGLKNLVVTGLCSDIINQSFSNTYITAVAGWAGVLAQNMVATRRLAGGQYGYTLLNHPPNATPFQLPRNLVAIGNRPAGTHQNHTIIGDNQYTSNYHTALAYYISSLMHMDLLNWERIRRGVKDYAANDRAPLNAGGNPLFQGSVAGDAGTYPDPVHADIEKQIDTWWDLIHTDNSPVKRILYDCIFNKNYQEYGNNDNNKLNRMRGFLYSLYDLESIPNRNISKPDDKPNKYFRNEISEYSILGNIGDQEIDITSSREDYLRGSSRVSKDNMKKLPFSLRYIINKLNLDIEDKKSDIDTIFINELFNVVEKQFKDDFKKHAITILTNTINFTGVNYDGNPVRNMDAIVHNTNGMGANNRITKTDLNSLFSGNNNLFNLGPLYYNPVYNYINTGVNIRESHAPAGLNFPAVVVAAPNESVAIPISDTEIRNLPMLNADNGGIVIEGLPAIGADGALGNANRPAEINNRRNYVRAGAMMTNIARHIGVVLRGQFGHFTVGLEDYENSVKSLQDKVDKFAKKFIKEHFQKAVQQQNLNNTNSKHFVDEVLTKWDNFTSQQKNVFTKYMDIVELSNNEPIPPTKWSDAVKNKSLYRLNIKKNKKEKGKITQFAKDLPNYKKEFKNLYYRTDINQDLENPQKIEIPSDFLKVNKDENKRLFQHIYMAVFNSKDKSSNTGTGGVQSGGALESFIYSWAPGKQLSPISFETDLVKTQKVTFYNWSIRNVIFNILKNYNKHHSRILTDDELVETEDDLVDELRKYISRHENNRWNRDEKGIYILDKKGNKFHIDNDVNYKKFQEMFQNMGECYSSYYINEEKCDSYIAECVLDKGNANLDKCIEYLKKEDFPRVLQKEVKNMHPYIAFGTLKKLGFKAVSTTDDSNTNGQQILKVQPYSEWLKWAKRHINDEQKTSNLEDEVIKTYLIYLVEFINSNPRILNKNYEGPTNESNGETNNLKNTACKYDGARPFRKDVGRGNIVIKPQSSIQSNIMTQYQTPPVIMALGGGDIYIDSQIGGKTNLKEVVNKYGSRLISNMYEKLKRALEIKNKKLSPSFNEKMDRKIKELGTLEQELVKSVHHIEEVTDILDVMKSSPVDDNFNESTLKKFINKNNYLRHKHKTAEDNMGSILTELQKMVQRLDNINNNQQGVSTNGIDLALP